MLPSRRVAILLALGLVGLTAACGDDPSGEDPAVTTTTPGDDGPALLAPAPVPDRESSDADPDVAGEAITAFGVDAFGTARTAAGEPGNLTVSPASIAVALAMVELGATGEGQTELRELLHIDDPAAYHASMNALEQDLESRQPDEVGDDGDPGELAMNIANAVYVDDGYPLTASYLDAIGQAYGPVVNTTDFATDPAAVAAEINDWVAGETNEKIVDLVPESAITPDTVLAVVNALYLNASWQDTFDAGQTSDEMFTRLDDSTVDVPMMHGGSDSSAQGDGWVGATKHYTGGLSAQFILPDEGRFDEVAGDLGTVFADYETARVAGAELVLPRFETRFGTELSDVLRSLGVTAPYEPGNLLGIGDDPDLLISSVVHQTFVAMDEEGTEAAAATAVIMDAGAAPSETEPVPVRLDRPFVYRIVDNASGATLFIGQIADPTAG